MVKISGVLANPTGTDKNAEYVVISNTDAQPVSVLGWKIQTGSGKKISVTGTIAPGGTLKVMSGSVALKNTGDTLSLLSSAGQVVDTYTYAAAADGQVLQPAAFLSPELKAELFEELATRTPAEGPLSGQAAAAPAGSTILLAATCAAILAALAVYVVKHVRYDEIVKNPFAKDSGSL